MKAKDYLEKIKPYIDTPDFDIELAKICKEFIFEAADIIKARNIKKDAGTIAVFREQDLKFQSFARELSKISNMGIKSNGFKIALEILMPEVYELIYS